MFPVLSLYSVTFQNMLHTTGFVSNFNVIFTTVVVDGKPRRPINTNKLFFSFGIQVFSTSGIISDGEKHKN